MGKVFIFPRLFKTIKHPVLYEMSIVLAIPSPLILKQRKGVDGAKAATLHGRPRER